jgi:hypothetical protein
LELPAEVDGSGREQQAIRAVAEIVRRRRHPARQDSLHASIGMSVEARLAFFNSPRLKGSALNPTRTAIANASSGATTRRHAHETRVTVLGRFEVRREAREVVDHLCERHGRLSAATG